MILGLLDVAFFLLAIILAIIFYKKFPVVESKILFASTVLVSFWLLMDIFVYFGIMNLVAHHIKYISIVSCPVLFLFTTIYYTNNNHFFNKINKKLFWIIPTITMIMIAINQWFSLMWSKVEFVNISGYYMVTTQKTLMFWVHTAYSYSLILISLLLLINKFIKSPPIYRRQCGFLLFGTILGWLSNIIFLLETSGRYPLDPSPVCFFIILFVFYWGLFQYGRHRIVPLARHLIVENMEDMVLAMDNADRIIDINPSLKRKLLEISSDKDFIGLDASQLFFSIPNLSDTVVNFSGKRNFIFGEGDNARYYEVEKTDVLDEDQSKIGSLLVLHDITDMHRVLKKLEYMTCYDQLTGLYNRTFFEIQLERFDSPEHLPVSIIVADVNGLKMTNDAFGHSVGDELLRKVTQIIKSVGRPEDIVARTGGDEFSMILPKTSEAEAMMIIERIKAVCEKTEEKPIRLSVSWGHAAKNSAGKDIRMVLKEADASMYKKKLLESRSTHGEIVTSLIQTLKESSFETNEHAERMKAMSYRLAKELNLTESQMDDLLLLALLHDLGKVGISDKILEKKGKLTFDEWEIMKRHTEIGYHIALSSNDLSPIAEAILSHHERWDGNGYPRKLKGLEIPYLARIISVVDSYDVMTNERVYKKPISKEEALQELQRCSGGQFDPSIVKVFCEIIQEYGTDCDQNIFHA